jgi:hypothetical protein
MTNDWLIIILIVVTVSVLSGLEIIADRSPRRDL